MPTTQQLIRAIDSVGANMVEGDGRFGKADGLHFMVIARASAREARYWIERSMVRRLLPSEDGQRMVETLHQATRQLNALIRYRRRNTLATAVREAAIRYDTASGTPAEFPASTALDDTGDPFTDES